jgi:hypothetical protein
MVTLYVKWTWLTTEWGGAPRDVYFYSDLITVFKCNVQYGSGLYNPFVQRQTTHNVERLNHPKG